MAIRKKYGWVSYSKWWEVLLGLLSGVTHVVVKGRLFLCQKIGARRRDDERPSQVESFHLNFNQPMAPLYTSIWDNPLSLLRPTRGVSIKTINLFQIQSSMVKFMYRNSHISISLTSPENHHNKSPSTKHYITNQPTMHINF